MVTKVIDICDKINLSLPENSPYKSLNTMLVYDTSRLKQKVKENNPKPLVSEVNKQKSYVKATDKKKDITLMQRHTKICQNIHMLIQILN